MKQVEHVELPYSLVKGIQEETDAERRQQLLTTLTQLLSCVPLETRTRPFVTSLQEVPTTQEKLKHGAVLTLTEQLSYWQFYRTRLRTQSLTQYLNMCKLLPITSRGGKFYATVIKEFEDDNDFAVARYVSELSLAGDGDFWARLEDGVIKISELLCDRYEINHLPVIPLTEIGITQDQVRAVAHARYDYYQMISELYSNNIRLQVLDGFLPVATASALPNPLSVYMTLVRHFGDFDQGEEANTAFNQRFDGYISELEWDSLFRCLDIMISELQNLVKIAYAHT